MGVNWEVVLWTCMTFVVIMSVIGLALAFISAKNMRRRREDVREVYTELKIGSRIIFAGGIYGRVAGIEDETVNVEIAKNIVIKISRYAIRSIED